jgi:hypothetical protein
MNDEQIFELAEKIGFQDDFGRWNFTSEGLLDFVFMVQKREWEELNVNEVREVIYENVPNPNPELLDKLYGLVASVDLWLQEKNT